MKTKIYILTVVLLTLIGQRVNAQTATVGVAFHFFSVQASSTEQELMELICQINWEFNSVNNTGIRFYLDRREVHTSGTPATIQKQSHIDIYKYGSNSAFYQGTSDKIITNGFVVNELVHEIGHALGLKHPDGGGLGTLLATCDCTGGPGGADCVSDTTPPVFGNYMNQGAWLGSNFTAGQTARMHWCISQRGWAFGNHFALHNSPLNAVPWAMFSTTGATTGSISWAMPTACTANPPLETEVIVETWCDNNANEYQLRYTTNDIASPLNIDLTWGVKSITYIYTYVFGTNKVYKPMDIPFSNLSPCTAGDPDGKIANYVPAVYENSRSLRLVNNAHTSVISLVNTGYSTITVFDLSGRVLMQQELPQGNSSLDISALPPGAYIMKADDDKHEVHKRFHKL